MSCVAPVCWHSEPECDLNSSFVIRQCDKSFPFCEATAASEGAAAALLGGAVYSSPAARLSAVQDVVTLCSLAETGAKVLRELHSDATWGEVTPCAH